MFKLLAALSLLAVPAFAQQAEPVAPGIVPPGIPFRAPNFIHPGRAVVLPPSGASVALQNFCPVGMAAQPGGIPQALWVASVEDAAHSVKFPAKTGIHVRLSSRLSTMTHLTVAVDYHVFAEGPLLVSGRSVPAQKVFELTAQDAMSLERNLLIGGNVEIVRVRVLAVTYSDGTTWHAESDATCSVRPSHYILMAAR